MKLTILFGALLLPLGAQVTVTQKAAGEISVDIAGKPFTTFWTGPESKKPYLHPLRAASGTSVTRGYPMLTDVPGEAHDHPHHRGLWFAHGDVNKYNFWAGEEGQDVPGIGKGVILSRGPAKLKSGKGSGTIDADFDWNAPDGTTLLRESRRMTFYDQPGVRMVDFDMTLTPVTEVTFGDTKEGMFAMRLAPGLEEEQPKGIPEPKRTGRLVNAQGKSGEKNVWGKRSEWVDDSGEIAGEKLGVAVLDHPSNPRHPTYWHARAYGLLANNIFGVHDFENNTADGSLTIRPGQPLRFRYRVIIHSGDAQTAGIADAYRKYAATK